MTLLTNEDVGGLTNVTADTVLTPVKTGYKVQFMEEGDSDWRNVMDFYLDAKGDKQTRPSIHTRKYDACLEASYIMKASIPKWANVNSVRVVPYVQG